MYRLSYFKGSDLLMKKQKLNCTFRLPNNSNTVEIIRLYDKA